MERDRADQAHALARVWAIAAAGLRDADGSLEAALSDGDVLGEAERSLSILDPRGAEGLRSAWEGMRRAVAESDAAARAAERARVLGHAVRGPCPPYEIEYGPEHFFGKSRRLGDVAAFYRAFGVEVSRLAREREDHVAIEAEFLSFLCLKRALAEGDGAAERAEVCRDAERLFLEEHVGRFLPSFSRRVDALGSGGLIASAARLAASAARVHASLVGARLGSPELELREIGTLEEETVVSCSPCTVPGASAGADADGVEV